MRHLAASVPKISTRILLSVFIAALFALLLMLPASGQGTFDRTDGRISSGSLSVGVFDDIEDAQLEKNIGTPYTNAGQTTTVYLPIENPGSYQGTRGSIYEDDIAYLADGRFSPQQTFSGETLWVSNNQVNDSDDPATTDTNERLLEGAYNTILITAERESVTPTPEAGGCAVATVRSPRANDAITVQMAETTATGGKTYYQAFVRVLDPLEENDDETLANESSDPGPACADYDAGVAHEATASILARHGDRITIDVAGAGAVSLDVDGEGPDLLDIKPVDLSRVRSNSLDFSFIVRDDDSGLRHDGELAVTADGDYMEVNEDDDHVTTGEPLSLPSGGQIRVNGEAAEIDLKVWDMNADFSTADDITDAGRWTLLGNRPGVAYSFVADTTDLDEGTYFMEVSAFDRAGNEAVSDALEDDGIDRYLFTVDDTDPTTLQAWTGIAYEMNNLGGLEVPDRSWIMVEFTEPVRQGIDPERLRVAGHEVLSVFQPQEAPDFRALLLESTSSGSPPAAPRLTFAPPAPRAGPLAATSLAPQMQTTCPDTLGAFVRVGGLDVVYGGATGDITISWNRLSSADCHGYRIAVRTQEEALLIEDIEINELRLDGNGNPFFSIPRASEVGRAIETYIKDADGKKLVTMVGLQYDAVGPHKDNFGRRTSIATRNLNDYTAPSDTVSSTVTAPYLLHSWPAPATLPTVSETTLGCSFTSPQSTGHDQVVLSFTHRPGTSGGWTRVGYYQQLIYDEDPQDDYDLGLLFSYTAIGADGFETSVNFQNYYDWESRKDPNDPGAFNGYDARADVVAVYENSSGRRFGATRSILCTGTPDTRAPVYQSSRVNGTLLTLTYNETLDGNSEPAGSAFSVEVAG